MFVRIFCTVGFLLVFSAGFSQNPVQTALKTFVAAPEFQNAGISFMAIDLATSEVIAEQNPELSLPTASTTKLFATATAIDILGPNYRPQTRIYVDGKIEKGVLAGNLWIRGGGDPALGSRYFNESGHEADFLKVWIDTLKKMGISTIQGAVYGDASEFGYSGIPDGWGWSDMGNYYGAGPSGLCVYDNTIRYQFKTGSVPGATTVLLSQFPVVPGMIFHNYIEASNVSGDNSYIYGAPYSLDRFGEGALPLNKASFEVKGSLPDPEFQLAYELTKAFEAAGIKVENGAKSVRQLEIADKNRYNQPGFQLIYAYNGPRIADIAKVTNQKSINLFAEELLCLVGYKQSGLGTTKEGLKYLEKYWRDRVAQTGLFLKDGSGLSRADGIAAVHFCQLLREMTLSPNYQEFFETLPVAGRSGTLVSLCKNQPGEGRVVAKSGTMQRVKSYAGYVQSKSGRKIAFAFIVNNFNGSSSGVVDKMEKVLNALAVY